MTARQLAIAGICITAAAFAVGRFTAPAKVITKVETKTVTQYVDRVQEKVVYVKAKDTAIHAETKTVKAADGTVTITKVVDSSAHSTSEANKDKESASATNSVATSESSKVVDFRKPDWRISAHAGWDLHKDLQPSLFGGEVDRRILGPFWVGAWGHTDGTLGLSLSMEF